MTTAHSPIPFSIHAIEGDERTFINDSSGDGVAVVHEGRADMADIIVNAVNAHDACVQALKMARVYCKAQAENSKSQFFLQQQAYADLKNIDRAIALASGTREEGK